MPKYAQNPSSYRSIDGRNQTTFTLTGGQPLATTLSDSADATYGKTKAPKKPIDTVYPGWPSLAAGERIVAVCPFVRAKRPGSKTVTAKAGLYTARSDGTRAIREGAALGLLYSAAAADEELAAYQGQQLVPGLLVEWDEDVVKALGYAYAYPALTLRDPHTNSANWASWYEAGWYFYATKAATVSSVSAPSGTIATTQWPELTATLAAIVESWQVPTDLPSFMCGIDVEFSVYSGTHTTPPSADPVFTFTKEDVIDEYIDGSTPSTLAVTVESPMPLPNGDYTLFVRVSRRHPSGVAAWSSYSYSQFTINAPSPTTPTLSLAASSANHCIGVTVNAPTTAGYDASTCLVQVQRQVGSVWRNVRNMIDEALTVGSDQLVGYDYEGERALTNTYRARVSMWHTVDAVRRYSAWDTDTETGPAVAGWNLKALEDPTASWLGAHVSPDPSEESQQAAATFHPLDRDKPVVVFGSAGGQGGQLRVIAEGSTAVAALRAFAAYKGPSLLEDGWGLAKHIAVTATSWVRGGASDEPRLEAVIAYTETDAGLAESTT